MEVLYLLFDIIFDLNDLISVLEWYTLFNPFYSTLTSDRKRDKGVMKGGEGLS
jgi:ABC-type polysaccharide/polyol phosphate export permease